MTSIVRRDITKNAHTRKMGCLRANFATPPLMMLVWRVMMPAYDRIDVQHEEILSHYAGISKCTHHLNRPTE